MLNAFKAFNIVNLLTLFKTLYSRGLCPIYLRLLMKIYEEQKMRIRTMPLLIILQYVTVLNRVVCCLMFCSVCTWTSSYHRYNVVWVAI